MSQPVPPQDVPQASQAQREQQEAAAHQQLQQPQEGTGQSPKKRSKAPIIIGIIIIIVLILCSCATCSVAPFVMKSSSQSDGFFSEKVGVIQFNESIAANTGMTPERMRAMLDAAEKDKSIKAVVIRVNSPGGTVAASEEVTSYIEDFSKPVVFSVSDMCASGAYMAASQSDLIMAMPMSSVGSIGVIMSTINIEKLLDEVGIEMDAITSSEGKDAGAVYRQMTEAERKLFQDQVDSLNQAFIDIVAEGRDMDRAEVEKLATGMTYSGTTALEYGLIDELGNYQDALDTAAEMGGITHDNYIEYSLDSYGMTNMSLFNLFMKSASASLAEAFNEQSGQIIENNGIYRFEK